MKYMHILEFNQVRLVSVFGQVLYRQENAHQLCTRGQGNLVE